MKRLIFFLFFIFNITATEIAVIDSNIIKNNPILKKFFDYEPFFAHHSEPDYDIKQKKTQIITQNDNSLNTAIKDWSEELNIDIVLWKGSSLVYNSAKIDKTKQFLLWFLKNKDFYLFNV